MKLIDYIKEMLVQKGTSAVADLGIFSATAGSASLKGEEGVMLPPSLKVEFSENRYREEVHSLLDYAKAKGEIEEDELVRELENFVKGVKNGLSQHGRCELEGLGVLKKPLDGGPTFLEQSQELLLGAESFGLPKIEPKPLTSANTEPPAPIAKQSNQLLIAAIAIPLAVVFIVFLYFLYNKQAYDSVVAYFQETPAVVADKAEQSGSPDSAQALADNASGTEEEGEGKADAADSSGKDNETASGNDPSASGSSTTSDSGSNSSGSTGSNSDMLITSSDSRFYVIIGSYSDMASAKKKARECRKIGYGTAKVVKRGNRIRVSLEDFSQKDDASTFAGRIGKDYAGAWVFSN